MADKTMWRGQSATLTIENLQTLSGAHINSYTFDVLNGSTSANTSFSGSGDGTSNGRAISTSAHVASGNTTGYTDYTVKGYLKYTHNAYGTQTKATSNTVTKSLRVQEPLDAESLSNFTISPTTVWSNFPDVQTITVTPSFTCTPYLKSGEITCSQDIDAVGGGSVGKNPITLDGTDVIEYQNTNSDKDLKAKTKDIEFKLYSIAGESADKRALVRSRSLTVKNAVTKLEISNSLHAYNNASSWNNTESVRYTPTTPYSKNVSLVYATTDTAYSNNTITQNGVSVSLNPSTGVLTFNTSKVTDASKESTFKFRVKSVETHGSVYSNVMTLTVHGFTASRTVDIWEGETFTIDNLGFGTVGVIPQGLTNVTVTTSTNKLGITITGKAVSGNKTETFTITSTSGSKVTITCNVKNLADVNRTINTGDTITITGQEIKALNTSTKITSISAITAGPASGKGTAYLSEGKLIYYAPGTAQEDVPITVTTNTGASAVIHMKVKAITMTIA